VVFWRALTLQTGTGELPANEYATVAAEFLDRGAPKQALQFFDAALAEFDERSASVARYQLLNDRALAWIGVGRLNRARSDLGSALELAGAADNRIMRIMVLRNLSEVERRTNNLERALALAAEGVAIARSGQNRHELIEALGTLGLAEVALGQFKAASEAFHEAERLGRRDLESPDRAVVLGGLGAIEFAGGRYRRARGYYERAAELERAQDDSQHEAETMAALMEVFSRLADEEQFQVSLQRVIDLTQQRHTSIETALFATSRAGGAWLRGKRTDVAAEVFAAGILLALAEATNRSRAPDARTIGRAVIAPFVHAQLVGLPFAELEPLLTLRLRASLGRQTSFVTDLYPAAREAAAGVGPDSYRRG
jgi:tetratricopeptide (TPR) repeat protein